MTQCPICQAEIASRDEFQPPNGHSTATCTNGHRWSYDHTMPGIFWALYDDIKGKLN
jgi:hypothetical protein